MEGSQGDDARMKVHTMVRRTVWALTVVALLAIIYLYIHGQSVYGTIAGE